MNNKLKLTFGAALLLLTSVAVAGIIFVPVGGRYINPELASVDIQNVGDGLLRIRSTGLNGVFSLDASDVPSEFDPPVSGCKRLRFDQRLELIINLSLGVVEGRSRGRIDTRSGGILDYRVEIRGNATCVPSGGNSCGQIVVDLEARGVLSNENAPARVGLIRMEKLGSLVRGASGASWASLTANARLGGEEALIGMLTAMEEGESCGV